MPPYRFKDSHALVVIADAGKLRDFQRGITEALVSPECVTPGADLLVYSMFCPNSCKVLPL